MIPTTNCSPSTRVRTFSKKVEKNRVMAIAAKTGQRGGAIYQVGGLYLSSGMATLTGKTKFTGNEAMPNFGKSTRQIERCVADGQRQRLQRHRT